MDVEAKENIGDRLQLIASVAWLFMDYAWMEEAVTVAVICAVPSTVCSIAAVAFVRADFTTRAVTAAMAAWSVMNALWMLSDLKVYEAMLLARASFMVGMLCLISAFIVSGSLRDVLTQATHAFRRLRK